MDLSDYKCLYTQDYIGNHVLMAKKNNLLVQQ